jgi:hypothetical protein
VFLHTDTADTSSTVRAETAPDGSFAFEAVAAGEQHISVLAEGYLIPNEVRFVLLPADTLWEVPIRLSSGMLRRLRIVDAAGHPPAGADIVAVSSGVLRATTQADQEGRARIRSPMPPPVVFILGRDGAFAALRSTSDDVTWSLPSADILAPHHHSNYPRPAAPQCGHADRLRRRDPSRSTSPPALSAPTAPPD